MKRCNALEGIKVVDLSWVIVGPYTMRYLADYGAEVIRVESSTRPEACRTLPPFKDHEIGIDNSGLYPNYNANKYGVSLNLNHPKGREIAKRLIIRADIVAESFTAGSMKKWGLAYEDIVQFNPSVIMISMTMQGQTGPHRLHPGYGATLQALTGFNHFLGWSDGPPCLPGVPYTDFIAPPLGVAAVLAALDFRRRTGKGQYIDLSQYEAGVQFVEPAVLDYTVNGREQQRMGNQDPAAAPHAAYRCQGDDRWCVIAVFDDHEWQALVRAMGSPVWAADDRFGSLLGRKKHEAELDRLVEEWTVRFSAEEVMHRLQAACVPAGVVQNGADLHADPQLAHREHYPELDHLVIGRHTYDSLPFRLSKTPAEMRSAGPCLGEHNEYVYRQILGIPEEEYVELLLEGVFE